MTKRYATKDITINDRTKVFHNGEYWMLPGRQKVRHYSEALRLARAMDYMMYGDLLRS